MSEDPLARIHREYREKCQEWGTYRPPTEQELAAAESRWKAESNRKLEISRNKPQRRRASRKRGEKET